MAKLARYHRMLTRRRPAAGKAALRRYRAAKRPAAKQHAHVAAQRGDTGRKVGRGDVVEPHWTYCHRAVIFVQQAGCAQGRQAGVAGGCTHVRGGEDVRWG